jgi:hypothetical protein
MKKTMIVSLMIVLSLACFSQRNVMTGDFYLQKSKNQKTAAYITLGCGAATMIPGLILLNQTEPGWEHVDWNKALGGSALVIAGAGFLTSSIILFAASARNKRKARMVSVYINKPVLVNTGAWKKTLPYSIGITIPIR